MSLNIYNTFILYNEFIQYYQCIRYDQCIRHYQCIRYYQCINNCLIIWIISSENPVILSIIGINTHIYALPAHIILFIYFKWFSYPFVRRSYIRQVNGSMLRKFSELVKNIFYRTLLKFTQFYQNLSKIIIFYVKSSLIHTLVLLMCANSILTGKVIVNLKQNL